jgi:hypothetical protein
MRLWILAGLSGLALAACSDEKPKKYFETQGLVAPISACAVDPRAFGEAEKISDFHEGNGCGVDNAWRVYSVGTVRLSQPGTFNCRQAGQVNRWMQGPVQAAAQDIFGEPVVEVKVAASYSCRPRNNVRGAKLSEHGFGNAIDVSGFTLASGRTVSVLEDWNGGRDERAFLRAVRADACGPFRTVLGPGSDANHRDHLHLDLQNHRSGGTYCH